MFGKKDNLKNKNFQGEPYKYLNKVLEFNQGDK